MFNRSPVASGKPGDEAAEDFKSLLGRTEKSPASDLGTNTQSFDMQHVTGSSSSPKNQFVQLPSKSSQSHGSKSGGNLTVVLRQLLKRIAAYINMLCYFYPCLCGSLVFLCIGILLWSLGQVLFNPVVEYGVVKHHHDHAFLDSQYNAALGQIDHWCLRGDNLSCKCEDPLQPSSRADRKSWRLAFKTNRKVVKALVESNIDLDLLFLGESVVEEMDGRWMGQNRSPTLQKMAALFKERFDKTQVNAKLNAAALGIAGDTAPNVLWRLMHGEMVEQLNPKIWWLSLGMNDLARMQCSEEVVVLGILRVVEEILRQKPTAQIVINSLFPMSRIRGAIYPSRTDYQDSFPELKQRQKASRTADASLQVPKPLPRGGAGGGGRRQLTTTTSEQRTLRMMKGKRNKEDSDSASKMTEEQAADAEDARIEKQERKKKRGGWFFRGKDEKIKARDTILTEQHQVRKRISDVRLPLWTSVLAVNQELKQFAKNTERVTFFDVTTMFTQHNENTNLNTLRTDLISLRGHPSLQGFDVWEKAVADQALQILDDLRKHNPEYFAADKNDADAVISDVLNQDGFPDDDDFGDDAFTAGTGDDFLSNGMIGDEVDNNPKADAAAAADGNNNNSGGGGGTGGGN